MVEIPLTFKCKNQQIVGILHLPKEGRKIPLVILVHGWGVNKLGTWNAFFVKAAREFSKNGFAVLRFDFRGSGDSEGKFENQTITSMLRDLDNVITQVKKYPEIDKERIYLIGHSLGGYIALIKASLDKRVKGVIVWCGRPHLKDLWGEIWFEEIKRRGYIISDGYKFTKKHLKDEMKYDLVKAIKKIRVPIGLIYGENDEWVPPSAGLKIFQMLKCSKRIKIVKNLDHFFTEEATQKEVIKTTLRWLNKIKTSQKLN